MRIIDITDLLQKEVDKEIENIKERKRNINSDYTLAKIDFRCIENMEDYVETMEHVINIINDCQERIIERNRRSI